MDKCKVHPKMRCIEVEERRRLRKKVVNVLDNTMGKGLRNKGAKLRGNDIVRKVDIYL